MKRLVYIILYVVLAASAQVRVTGRVIDLQNKPVSDASNKEVWDYANSFVTFNRFTLNTLAYYKGRILNLPFSMNTFHQIWGVVRPEEANYVLSGVLKLLEMN